MKENNNKKYMKIDEIISKFERAKWGMASSSLRTQLKQDGWIIGYYGYPNINVDLLIKLCEEYNIEKIKFNTINIGFINTKKILMFKGDKK